MDILPAIDLRGGKCVRLLQGDYDKQIDYADDPLAVARQFEQAGAAWLHLVDLDGAREGHPRNRPTIERILTHTQLRVEIGGGLRETDAIESLIDAGASRCVVGTKALEDWDWFAELVQRPKCRAHIALGLDARQGQLAVHGWTRATTDTPIEVARRVSDWPLAAIIYTDISRDGMMVGPNIEATAEMAEATFRLKPGPMDQSRDIAATAAMAEASRVPVIASGGVTTIEDVRQLAALPLGGIIIGRAIYEKKIDLAEAIRVARGR